MISTKINTTFDIWPAGKMPGYGAKEPEFEMPKQDAYHRFTNISRPTLTLFPAPRTDSSCPTMIISPGGGYSHVVIDKEGTEIAEWLNSIGITALVLKYRVPDNRAGALWDIQRALRVARSRASAWNIDPKRLGVIGFSAGGNLSAKVSTLFDHLAYPTIDAIDEQSCRPDFAVLVYPAYLENQQGLITPDLNLKANIPPTLIIHNEDDSNYFAGGKLYDAALTEAGAPHEFVRYKTGGHGYGLHCAGEARAWPDAASAWLLQHGFCQDKIKPQN